MGHTFVTGVKVGLSMSLQMAGDVGCTEHLPTDATGDLAFMPDHVGTESVFGGKSRGTGLQPHSRQGQRSVEYNNNNNGDNLVLDSNDSYRYLTFKRPFWGMHMLHMAAQVVWPRFKKKSKNNDN